MKQKKTKKAKPVNRVLAWGWKRADGKLMRGAVASEGQAWHSNPMCSIVRVEIREI